eukprot:767147-Hanusia_phi.AAC.7
MGQPSRHYIAHPERSWRSIGQRSTKRHEGSRSPMEASSGMHTDRSPYLETASRPKLFRSRKERG